jgi:putative ABC transport system permease protein
MLRLAPLILRNVLRSRRRSLLTLASAAVSLAVLGLLVALYQGFFFSEQSSPSEALRLITRHKVSLTNPLPASHQARIAAIDGVEAVSAWSWFQGIYKDNKPENFFARFAVDPDLIERVRVDYVAPKEQWQAFQRNRTGCAIGRKIAEQHGIKLGDRINITGDIYPVNLELTVEMIYDHPKNTECLMFHRQYLDELLKANGGDADTVGTYAILARSPDDVHRVAKAIDAMFENSPYPTKTETEREFGLSFMAFLGNIKLYLAAVCAAI